MTTDEQGDPGVYFRDLRPLRLTTKITFSPRVGDGKVGVGIGISWPDGATPLEIAEAFHEATESMRQQIDDELGGEDRTA